MKYNTVKKVFIANEIVDIYLKQTLSNLFKIVVLIKFCISNAYKWAKLADLNNE